MTVGQMFHLVSGSPGQPQPAATDKTAASDTVSITCNRQTVSVSRSGTETLLETARRAGLSPPFSCEAGNCGTCIARVVEGTATMRVNNALDDDEVADGYVLTCQAVPDCASVAVDYE